ncbi:DNA cytosine methyltransferase [Candidatus Poriferisodalis sp.]|uniref:DNA cytosine methyltransferase n=1 Tax=Candidatus Poriferisodalis sp. TaxID=3101277 RepID=UPI003B012092
MPCTTSDLAVAADPAATDRGVAAGSLATTGELTAVDLFAGAGGSAQGLTDAGFRILAAIENDVFAASTLSANHANTIVVSEDIVSVCPRAFREQLKIGRSELTLLTACPPCQGFSSLGSRDRDDARNDMIGQVWRFAKEFLPQAILVENVPSLGRDQRWSELRADAVGHGYSFGSWTVNATDFGVPQRRRRLIGIAVRRSGVAFPTFLTDVLPWSFVLKPPHASDVIARAGDVGASSDPLHRARTPTRRVLERIRAIPAGGSHVDLPEDLQLDCHKRLRNAGRTAAAGPYGRIPATGPAPTMTTRCTTPSCGRFLHPTEDRAISLREAALLQTFPPDYQFCGTHDAAERQIGNAVPVRLAHALGLAVRQMLAVSQEVEQHERT